ncbi:4Fe-4S single cluster domain-containing protein [Fusobacterium polymorphum]|uniref:4Fe-4S single cluster domain-containing protein n=1 Tax=Fusobacterium nucleatum subsp. polymorphum TaxID=76857 RepID=UPI00300A7BEE
MLILEKKDLTSNLNNNKKLNIAYINVCTETEGPYKRFTIWFQGCDILCKGCCNPELQALKIRHVMTVEELFNIILDSKEKYNIEGVTFLGGEPTLQKGLISLVSLLKMNNIGTILFTGKRIEMLDNDLVSNLDLVIDGKFEASKIDTKRNLIGSENQNIYFITNRYKKDKKWFFEKREKKVEVNIDKENSIFISGDVI